MKPLYKLFVSAVLMLFVIHGKTQLSAPMNFPLPPNISAANVSAAEYYFDNDPGLGSGTNIPVSAGSDVSVSNFAVAINALSTGVHRLYVRVKNSNGAWSVTNEANFFIIPQGALFPANAGVANVSAAEYFFDKDPGFGSGASIPVSAGSDVSANNVAIPIDTLSTGVHHLYVRAKNSNGNWSLANTASFYIVQGGALFPSNPGAASITAAEYFLDNDPGFGNGINIPIASGEDVSASNLAIPIDTLSTGVHRIYVRAKNTNNNWSVANVAAFYVVPVNFSVPANPAKGNITALEYFFDRDPGFGNGTFISVTPTADLSNYQITADISTLQQDTVHTLYVRALDGWSQTTSTTFIIGAKETPVTWLSFTGKLQADNSVLLQWQTATELNSNHFEIERSGDGSNFTLIGKADGAGNSSAAHSYTFTDARPLAGTDYYRIKEVDNDGNFTYSSILTVNTNTSNVKGFYIINNPAHSYLRVHIGSSTANAQLQIFDLNGRELLHETVAVGDIQQIDVSGLVSGIYVIRYTGADETTSKRFIKE